MTTPPPQLDRNRVFRDRSAPMIRTLLLVALFCFSCLAFAVVAKKAHKAITGARPKTVAHSKGRSVARGQRSNAPDISPERGTAAAEAAQATLAETPSAPFLYPHALDPFFRAVAAQQTQASGPNALNTIPALASTVRVLQFGDSHTAADIFTGEMRAQLQGRFGNGGLGFQFPGHPFAGYRLAGSSRSQSSGWFTEGNKFTHLGDGDLGLGGISITANRPGESVTLSTTCSTMQVQYLRQAEGGHLRFTDNGTFISDIDTSVSQSADAAVGQAGGTSAGTMTYACTPGVHAFELTTLDRAPVRLLGLVTEQPGITYECLGINGAVAPLMLRWNQEIFADYLRERDPNLIVLAYGTNEAASGAGMNEEYVEQFNRLLENLHRIVPKAAVLVLGPYDRATRVGRGRRALWQTFRGTDRIIADQKEACRIHHCAFYDERQRMGGPGAMIRWVSAGLAQPDRTHLTGTGYRALAEAFYRDVLGAYKAYQKTAGDAGTVSRVYSFPADNHIDNSKKEIHHG
ncbi:GDSL-type esterase/lipase family protein [Granulicella sibirica]|uniref:Putative periplasmic protein n=1 Tax=Granulicella sibirica TaxID=2479048 RepID=A0A4Q0T4A7_9BACT|nr:GDSL-type esterase/lipase family protein [Granulicella sibirica]RXH57772.1 putative periplasmic protein [Granulicella sibirica]